MIKLKTLILFIGLLTPIFGQWYDLESEFVDEYHFPNRIITGLAYDGENIWFTDVAADSILSFNIEQEVINGGFPFPIEPDFWGLTFDGEYFWSGSYGRMIHQISFEGELIKSFVLPYPAGTNTCVSGFSWVDGLLYCTFTAGFGSRVLGIDPFNETTVIELQPGECSSPTGLTYFEGSFWINDYVSLVIRKLSGNEGYYQGHFHSHYLAYKWIGLTNDGEYIYFSDNYQNIFKYSVVDSATVSTEDVIVSGPEGYTVYNAYPNPFNPSTNIQFTLENTERVSITIFDIKGREIDKVLENELMQPGEHHIHWDVDNGITSSGIYIVQFKISDRIFTQKITFMK